MDTTTTTKPRKTKPKAAIAEAFDPGPAALDMSPTKRTDPRAVKCVDERHGADWTLYQGDCVHIFGQLPKDSIDFSVHSPPFANLYTYSDSALDMGNCVDDAEFMRHYQFAIEHLYRVTKPGRVASVHCKDLVDYKGADGRAGLRDFPGEIIRAYERAGWKYHSRVTVWKCPVTEQRKTKAHGLLYKQLRDDSSFSRQGLAEYVLTFRKWANEGDATSPVCHVTPVCSKCATECKRGACEKCGGEPMIPIGRDNEGVLLSTWQQWASPVWMDIDQTDVLNVSAARDDKDEKHMCPLQLDLIDRLVMLYSNPGEVVATLFAGVGSELVGALRRGRKAFGTELKASYFERGCLNAREAEPNAKGSQMGLFGGLA